MQVTVKKLVLRFNFPGNTSRGTLYEKPSWFIFLEKDGFTGIGECSVIPGLSPEFDDHYEEKIKEVAARISLDDFPAFTELTEYPSIRFGLETALLNLQTKRDYVLFPSAFTRGEKGIPINGLVWMGTQKEMQARIKEKLENGFRVLKLKVGSLGFEDELEMLKAVRNQFSPDELEIRLDANGAFSFSEAAEKLNRLSEMQIHSIEQPIKSGQWDEMAELVQLSPIPVALDEELIGISTKSEKLRMLKTINPQFIILKPGLIGGFEQSGEWISMANDEGIGWWTTSALESNIGLNAIAQWVFKLNPSLVQGLGTGQVYANNISSPLSLKGDRLFYNPEGKWLTEEIPMQTIYG
jgi:o-succinylbenzoate synthase